MDPWSAPGAHYYPPPPNYHHFTDYQSPQQVPVQNQNIPPRDLNFAPDFQPFEKMAFFGNSNSNFPPKIHQNFPEFPAGNYSIFPPFQQFENFEKSIDNSNFCAEKNGYSLGFYGENRSGGGPEKGRNSREIDENGAVGGDHFEWMKPKRQRDSNSKKQPTFSKYQQMELEKEYLVEKYVKPDKKVELAKRLDITETQVKTWYQNRRQKEKNIEKNKKRNSTGTNSTRSSATPDSN